VHVAFPFNHDVLQEAKLKDRGYDLQEVLTKETEEDPNIGVKESVLLL
jgi:hypothetical protein